MSDYYDPQTVKQSGVPVTMRPRILSGGRRLVAVSSNGLWDRACDVTNDSEYKLFYDQYAAGYFLSWDLYIFDPRNAEPEAGR